MESGSKGCDHLVFSYTVVPARTGRTQHKGYFSSCAKATGGYVKHPPRVRVVACFPTDCVKGHGKRTQAVYTLFEYPRFHDDASSSSSSSGTIAWGKGPVVDNGVALGADNVRTITETLQRRGEDLPKPLQGATVYTTAASGPPLDAHQILCEYYSPYSDKPPAVVCKVSHDGQQQQQQQQQHSNTFHPTTETYREQEGRLLLLAKRHVDSSDGPVLEVQAMQVSASVPPDTDRGVFDMQITESYRPFYIEYDLDASLVPAARKSSLNVGTRNAIFESTSNIKTLPTGDIRFDLVVPAVVSRTWWTDMFDSGVAAFGLEANPSIPNTDAFGWVDPQSVFRCLLPNVTLSRDETPHLVYVCASRQASPLRDVPLGYVELTTGDEEDVLVNCDAPTTRDLEIPLTPPPGFKGQAPVVRVHLWKMHYYSIDGRSASPPSPAWGWAIGEISLEIDRGILAELLQCSAADPGFANIAQELNGSLTNAAFVPVGTEEVVAAAAVKPAQKRAQRHGSGTTKRLCSVLLQDDDDDAETASDCRMSDDNDNDNSLLEAQ